MTIRCVSSRLPKRVFLSFAAMSIALAACGPALIGAAVGGGSGGSGGGGGATPPEQLFTASVLTPAATKTHPLVLTIEVTPTPDWPLSSLAYRLPGDVVDRQFEGLNTGDFPLAGLVRLTVVRSPAAGQLTIVAKRANGNEQSGALPFPAADSRDIEIEPVEVVGGSATLRWTATGGVVGRTFQVFRDAVNIGSVGDSGVPGRARFSFIDSVPHDPNDLLAHREYFVEDTLGGRSQVVVAHSPPKARPVPRHDDRGFSVPPPVGGQAGGWVGVPPFLLECATPGSPDRFPDLILVGRDGGIRLSVNPGSGLFGGPASVLQSTLPQNPARVVLEGNQAGLQRMAVSYPGEIQLLTAGPAGSLAMTLSKKYVAGELDVVREVLDVGWANCDGNNDLDLVVSVWPWDEPAGSFQLFILPDAWTASSPAPIQVASGTGTGSFVCQDIDNDHRTDVVFTSSHQHTVLLDPLGSAVHRSTPTVVGEGIRWDQVAFRDIDRDGDLDLLVLRSDDGAGKLAIYRTGVADLSQVSLFDLNTRLQVGSAMQRGHLQVADMDGDGLDDLVLRTILANQSSSVEFDSSLVSVFPGRSDGTGLQVWGAWGAPQVFDFVRSGLTPHVHCAIADLNDDGLLDFSVVHADEAPGNTNPMHFVTKLSQLDWSWQPLPSEAASYPLAGSVDLSAQVQSMAFGRDGFGVAGLPDPNTFRLLTPRLDPSGRRAGGWDAIELPGSGDYKAVQPSALPGATQDMIALTNLGVVGRLHRAGTGYSFTPLSTSTVSGADAIHPAILDGDALGDAIVRAGTSVSWIGSAGSVVGPTEIGSVDSLLVADLDRDGCSDLVTASGHRVSYWVRSSSGPSRTWDLPQGVSVTSLAIGRLAGDDMSIVVGASDGKVIVITRPLAGPAVVTVGDLAKAVTVRVADMDNDGAADIVATTADAVSILRNATAPPAVVPTFTEIALNLPATDLPDPQRNFRDLQLTLVDSDPFLDIVVLAGPQEDSRLLVWTPKFQQAPITPFR